MIGLLRAYPTVKQGRRKQPAAAGRPCGLYWFGLTEIMTYALTPASYDKLLPPENHELRRAVTIQNPLTEDWNILRTTLIPNMLNVPA